MVTWEQLPKQKNSAYEWPQLLLVHSLLIPLNRVPLVASKAGRSSHLCLPQCWCRFTCSHTQFLCWGFELQVILSAQQTSLHTKPFSQPGNYYFFYHVHMRNTMTFLQTTLLYFATRLFHPSMLTISL